MDIEEQTLKITLAFSFIYGHVLKVLQLEISSTFYCMYGPFSVIEFIFTNSL
jgi:hypothetical protein